MSIVFTSAFLLIKLLKHGDIEVNLDPKPKYPQSFSICHWNLNSIAVHNVRKFLHLKVSNIIHKYDILHLSKTYLDSSMALDESSLYLDLFESYK